jgi:hypothetical protein
LQSGGTGITIYGSSYSEIKFLNSTTGTAATDGTALVTSGLSFGINNREAGNVTIGTSNTVRITIDSGGDTTLNTGNIIQGTAAKGINFTANSAAAGMTSQLLNWYEEGTWTPTVNPSGGLITSYTSAGNYTRVGRICTATFKITITNNGTGSGYIQFTLPFTHANTAQVAVGSGEEIYNSGNMCMIRCNQNSNIAYMYFYNYTYPAATNSVLIGTVSYQV